MRILSHYFIGRFLGLYAMVLVVALLVLATVELVLNLDDISAFDRAAETTGPVAADPAAGEPFAALDALDALANTLRYLGLRLAAYYLPDVLPIASFIAVFLVFAMSGRALETLAAEAGGIRPIRIVAPVLGSALILSLATAVLHETVVLRADQIWSGEQRAQREPIDFGRDAFWLQKGRTITNVARAEPETRTLHDVEIFERDEAGRVVRVVRADRVRIGGDGRWHLEDAGVWTFDASSPRDAPVYEERAEWALDLEAIRGDRLLAADPALLPLRDLASYLARGPGRTSNSAKAAVRRATGRFHERLSRPWLVLVFALLAMPFALRVDGRGRIAGPAIAAVATLGLYFLVESAGKTLTRQELIPVGVAPWASMGVFCALASIFVLRRIR